MLLEKDFRDQAYLVANPRSCDVLANAPELMVV
jgi:hypothetical protein